MRFQFEEITNNEISKKKYKNPIGSFNSLFEISRFVIQSRRRGMIGKVFSNKPIIGIVGGIGSGKSFIARLFGEIGGLVIDSDSQIRQAYEDSQIRKILKQWWGDGVFKADGQVDRRAIAGRIFSDESQRRNLEGLLHPWVADQRDRLMAETAENPEVKAFIWDTPLLFETGLNRQCDAVVFVDCPVEIRQKRVLDTRGWDANEIIRREKLQWPLDKKKKMSHYVAVNTADAAAGRSQVREILSRILAN
jgi:dephospho-CoA kinase